MTTPVGPGRYREVLRPAVLAGVLYAPMVQVLDVLAWGERWNRREAVLGGVLFVVGMVLFLGAQLHFSAAARERAAVGRAVSTGVLPGGADERWLGRLGAERDRVRTTRTGAPGVSVGLAVLVAVTILLPQGPGRWGWVLAVGLVAFGGLVRRREDHRLGNADRLHRELEERLARV